MNFLNRLISARQGEERAVALAFGYFFLLLCCYYLLRPLRDAMAATAGLGRLPELFTYTFLVMLVITPLFGTLVARVRKRLLLPITYLFFASNMLLFVGLFHADPGSRTAAAAFYVWLSVFNMFVVSVFWSFMADIFRGGEAKRLFGPISAGGSAGAICGPLLTQSLAVEVGPAGLVLLSTLLLLLTIPLIGSLGRWSAHHHGEQELAAKSDGEGSIGGGALGGVRALFSSPYLLGIASILVIGAIVGTFMYIELQRLVFEAYPDVGDRTTFFARLDLAGNVLAMVLQGVVVSRIIARLGLVGGLVVMPLVALTSFIWLLAVPMLMPLAVSQVLRRSGEFGLSKPSREVLYTAVDAETKYKAKNFIDTVVQRGSDTAGSWLHGLLAVRGVALDGFAAMSALLMLILIGVGIALARAFRLRELATTGSQG
ncbi:MAG: NTP/NDP exchange transporter [Steroidobacteraceae bacterium]